MVELIVVGVVAGFLAGISPCILPVLPVILVAGAGPSAGEEKEPGRAGLGRPLAVIIGLVLSFSLLVLAGSELLSALDLPQDSLRDAGIAVLVLVGLGYLIPPLGDLFERPFSRISTRKPNGRAGGFVLGLALGVLYVPCAGPILAAITVVGATHRVGLTAVFLTAAFAVGTAVPLLAYAFAGGQLTSRVGALRRHAPRVRQAGGAVLIIMAVVIAFNVLAPLQRLVPGYTTALQGSGKIRKELSNLTGGHQGSLSHCPTTATTLVDCGPAPNFTGITAWLNTPGGKPLTMRELRGKVVLVDFWTYSCINCLRALPYVKSWWERYRNDGLVVIGVHAPEFPFEKDLGNVKRAVHDLGITYPVALDNDYAIWRGFDNQYWPAHYFIDANGRIRGHHFGEGDYAGSEQLIRRLLGEAGAAQLPGESTSIQGSGVEAAANLDEVGSPETYLGYDRADNFVSPGGEIHDTPHAYRAPGPLNLNQWALSGDWRVEPQRAVSTASSAAIVFRFSARDLHLVLGPAPTGPIRFRITLDGHAPGADHGVDVQPDGSGAVSEQRLYQLLRQSNPQGEHTFRIEFLDPGVQAYSFTFG
jgi:cytochrome c biogenesis protein CcdA/thiol-disulfide isomerase/thioredoxin